MNNMETNQPISEKPMQNPNPPTSESVPVQTTVQNDVSQFPQFTAPQIKFSKIIKIFVIIIILLLGISGFLYYQKQHQNPVTMQPTPTPTETSVNKLVNPIATSSAFIELENSVASLSAKINSYNANDPSLSPPVIDLSLGFSF
jgi:hypothetical protein